MFWSNWETYSANNLVEQVRSTMPEDNPVIAGRAAACVDIVAYILKVNEVPRLPATCRWTRTRSRKSRYHSRESSRPPNRGIDRRPPAGARPFFMALSLLLNGRRVDISATPVRRRRLTHPGPRPHGRLEVRRRVSAALRGGDGRGRAGPQRAPRRQQLPACSRRWRPTASSARSNSLRERGELSEVQEAMAAAGGSQCGYCTPGFVMSLLAEQHRRDRQGALRSAVHGGQPVPVTATGRFAMPRMRITDAPHGTFRDRLERPAPPLERVATGGFSRPATLAEAIEMLHADPGATLIAGCTDPRRRSEPANEALAASGQRRGLPRTARVRGSRRGRSHRRAPFR